MNKKSHQWPKSALAAAALVVLGFAASPGYSMSLGRIAVRSALGEPLRAEIDIPEITTEEALTLAVSVANPEAFAAAGLEYNAALQGVQLSIQRRPDGRIYVLMTTNRSISDPFVDVILEARWSSGRIVRDYTMLFDPPSLRQPIQPTLPQVAESSQRQSATPAVVTPDANRAVASNVARSPAVPPVAVAPKPAAPKPAVSDEKKITVKVGDTASKIANRIKPGDVSLDQMLVAMMRTNPDAFSNGNLNRLRAGSVIDVPSAEEAKKVAPAEASQIVIAQSKDFNEFRRNLAGNAPKANVDTNARATGGKVEGKVEDKKASAATPDKLTLSKGSVQAKKDEALIAKERADKEAAARASELSKNISDLSKLSAAANNGAAPKASPASAAKPDAAPAVPAPVATPPVSSPAPAPAAPPAAPASQSASAPVQEAPASAPAPKPAPAKVAPPPAPPEPEAPGLVDELLSDPVVPAAAGGLIALLAGLAFWRQRRKKKDEAQVDSSFLASRLQPDSFFESSGLQQVDTSSGVPTDSASTDFSPSQMGSPDDVDPVAEADVYLAYGRDTQAEEILKEALRTTPDRVAIHAKLASIYAKRRDAANLQVSATRVFEIAGPDSAEWAAVCALGREVDPANGMYQPGGTPQNATAFAVPAAPVPVDVASTMAMQRPDDLPQGPVADVDLDLDLDFSADPEPAGASAEPAPAEPTMDLPDLAMDISPEPAPEPVPEPSLPDLSLDLDVPAPAQESESAPEAPANSIDFDLPFDNPPAAEPEPEPAKPASDGMLEFDLGSLSLDLDVPAAPKQEPAPAEPSIELDLDMTDELAPDGEDPLETKLALAEEFVSIGDSDGARALIEEVVAEATGSLRERAQLALSKLG